MINDVHGIDSHYHKACEFNGFIMTMTNSSQSRPNVKNVIFSCEGAALEVLMSVCPCVINFKFKASRRFQKVLEGSRRF